MNKLRERSVTLLIGTKFNGQEIIDQEFREVYNKLVKYVKIRCHCGSIRWLRFSSSVLESNSCGCLLSKLVSEHKKKHGGCGTRLYVIWKNMRTRCNDPSNHDYKHYGGRGVTVCPEWQQDYAIFQRWAEETGYKNTLTIDRIDVNGNYCPENCRWATTKQQSRNLRKTIYMTLNGVTKSMQDWCDELHLNSSMIEARRLLGWSDADCLLYKKNERYKFKDEGRALQ